jgi:glycosyltransferase involved in cell wall biosynthesis
MKVAIVHDYLNQRGGAEKVLEAITQLYPRAPVYTLLKGGRRAAASWAGADVRASRLQRMPFANRLYEKYLPLLPFFIEQIDLSDYDLVISDSSAWAKGVLTFPPTCHVSYLHTPMRFAWDYYHETVARMSWFYRGALRFTISYLRMWDVVATRRVDFLACNSRTVQERVRKYYGRFAEVIPPPVDTSFFTPAPNGDGGNDGPGAEPYFLIVSRLKRYKRVDVAVEAFRGLRRRLVIVGDGPERKELMKMAGPNVGFVPAADDATVREFHRHALAFLMPAYEDFGIAPVEAMACGKPVVAYRRGGALDTVQENVSGLFFDEQTPRALRDAVLAFDPSRFDARVIRSRAVRYDTSRFKSRFAEYVASCVERYARGVEVPASETLNRLTPPDASAAVPAPSAETAWSG